MNAIMKDESAPVFTCWNGIVAFRPDPFPPPSSRKPGSLSTFPASVEVPESHPWVQEGKVRPGMAPASMPELKFRASGSRECFGSESFNLPYDLRRVYDMQCVSFPPFFLIRFLVLPGRWPQSLTGRTECFLGKYT